MIRDIFFIIFFVLTIVAVLVSVGISIRILLRMRKKKFPLSKDFTETAKAMPQNEEVGVNKVQRTPYRLGSSNELFFKISEDFRRQLEELIGKEIQKNVEELKDELKKTSEEIIKSYKSQFASGSQEIQRVLGEFYQQIPKEVSHLSKFSLEIQNKISEEVKNKILELNQVAEKEFIKIQEANVKSSAQVYQLIQEAINRKVQETEKEIENYKNMRFKEIDRKIYQMLGEVAKKTLGKTIDLSTHEELVMRALEKAKKEIL